MKMVSCIRRFAKLAPVLAVVGIGLWGIFHSDREELASVELKEDSPVSGEGRDGRRDDSGPSLSARVTRQWRGEEDEAVSSMGKRETMRAVTEAASLPRKVALETFPANQDELAKWEVGERIELPIGSGDAVLEGTVTMNMLREDGGRAVRVQLGEKDEDGEFAGELFGDMDADGRMEGFIRYVGDSEVYRLTGDGEAPGLLLERVALDRFLCSFDAGRPDGMITPEEAAVPQSVVPPTEIVRPSVDAGSATISVGDVSMAEGQKKGNVMKFPVVSGIPSGSGKAAISVQWTLVPESASTGTDFKTAKGKLTLKRGATEGVISVSLKGDRLAEGDETFRVVLSNPVNVSLGKAEGSGTILDDEWLSTVTPGGSLAIFEPEGDVARKSIVRSLSFIVSPAVPEAVSFSWKLVPGTATTKDFKSKSGTVKLSAGQSGFSIPVTVLGDGIPEEDETFSVTFAKLPAMIEASPAEVTIKGSELLEQDPVIPSPVPAWESRPGASKVIYLEFNGATLTGTVWNKTNAPIVTPSVFSKFGNEGCEAIWSMVAEAYRPFDVNVTTSKVVFNATPTTHRTWCLFTSEPAKFNATSAGLGYMDSFGKPSLQPALAFADGDYTWDSFGTIATHELGHTLGLSHDGKGNEEYYGGHDGGVKSWGPWMGVPYYRFYRQFSKGEYAGATETEDDFALIARYLAPLADESGAALQLPLQQEGAAPSVSGIITHRDDSDTYELNLAVPRTVTVRLLANQPGNYSLAPAMRILDHAGGNVAPGAAGWTVGDGTLTWRGVLDAGSYQIEVDGVGDWSNPGFTDYGSVGFYEVQATE